MRVPRCGSTVEFKVAIGSSTASAQRAPGARIDDKLVANLIHEHPETGRARGSPHPDLIAMARPPRRMGAAAAHPPPSLLRRANANGRLRRGMDSLAALVQTALGEQPFSGDVFVFRGRRGDLVKLLWWSGDGMNLYAKRLEHGRFVWPQATSGVVHLSAAQLSMLLEGIDWRRPTRTWQPTVAA